MTVRVGLVGAGVMGADHAGTLASAVAGAALTAVSDADADRMDAVALRCGAQRTHADPHALIHDPSSPAKAPSAGAWCRSASCAASIRATWR